ncbi:DUF1302 domain-containing protein [Pseudomonas sp. BN417]|uniref:DUF1302 domain-containing protein n=1 Tax=Pseudomonas sp. BN417 TaxID=2567890 RepID=UPI00245711A9|nr:DUF1302 domain-containing protein [Pseudomonas sp. BN417]
MNALIDGKSVDFGRLALRRCNGKLMGVSLAGAAMLALPLGVAQAFQFHSEDWAGSLDTTLSYGVSYRAEGQDSKLIARANGGTGANGDKINKDDGDLNFRKGEVFSQVAKVVSELGLKYRDSYGLFVRGRAFYDFELEDDERRHRQIPGDGLDQAGSSIDLLDAFVYGRWTVSERNLNARLGRQVINWGEGLFYQNGIGATNPLDLGALRAPGSELKEAFLPTFMGYGSYELSDSLTVEAYYQPGWAWEATKVDVCGTYFSSNDFIGEGCDYVAAGAFDNPSVPGAPRAQFVPRTSDVDADDAAQLGVALRWYVPALNDTEFGFYHLRYSAQLPQVGATVAQKLGPVPIPSTATYHAEYLEHRELYGTSFNTTIGGDGFFSGQSLFGELTYRPNAPIALSPSALLRAALSNPAGRPAGTHIDGFREKEMYQLSLGTIRNIGAVLGADAANLQGEVVASRVMGLESDVDYGEVTSSAYGATAGLSLTYNNVFNIFSLVPSVSHGRTFNGVAPSLTNGLNEEAWSTSLGVDAIYQDQFTVGVRYVDYTGGDNGDRDFLSFNVKYSF